MDFSLSSVIRHAIDIQAVGCIRRNLEYRLLGILNLSLVLGGQETTELAHVLDLTVGGDSRLLNQLHGLVLALGDLQGLPRLGQDLPR